MDAENFFSRWSRRKAQARQEEQEKTAVEKQPADEQSEPLEPPPTMEDVAALTPQSDFRRFLARGVDPDVRRSAMKKMFADPHFNAMDGLDIYIDDYNKFQPLPDAMLAALNHAQGVLNPQPLFDSAPEKLLEETAPAPAAEDEGAEVEQLSALEDGAEKQSEATSQPIESIADDDAAAAAPHQRTENPERRPDHGNQIPGM